MKPENRSFFVGIGKRFNLVMIFFALIAISCGGEGEIKFLSKPAGNLTNPPDVLSAALSRACNVNRLNDLADNLFWDVTADEVECIYITSDGTGEEDGRNWDNAFSVQKLRDISADGDIEPTETQVYIYLLKAGTYKPTEVNDRYKYFTMRNRFAIIGGFSGNGFERMGITTLSGEIGDEMSTNDNSYSVIRNNNNGLDSSALLAHVTVSDSRGTRGGMYNDNVSPTVTEVTFSNNTSTIGGGMYNYNSSPTVTGSTFSSNSAIRGGGMYNDNSSPTVTASTFLANTADSADTTDTNGGGMYNENSSPTVTASTFSANTAEKGGGMYNENSSPTVTASTFSANTADTNGGGMYNETSSPTIIATDFLGNTALNEGGGMYNNERSSPDITDVTFLGNMAKYGGGMYNNERSSPDITDVTFLGNMAKYGGGMYNFNSSPIITDSNFLNNMVNDMGRPLDDDLLYDGGGMYNSNSSPTVIASTFSGNMANFYGGGMFNKASSPTVTASTFSGNTASDGAGMTNYFNGTLTTGIIGSSPTVIASTFSENTAMDIGGGMYNSYSSPTVIASTFSDNTANGSGGGMGNWKSKTTVTASTFSGNKSELGGGIVIYESTITLTASTFYQNEATENGGAVGVDNDGEGIVTLVNSLLWGNKVGESNSQVTNQVFLNTDGRRDEVLILRHSVLQDGVDNVADTGANLLERKIFWQDIKINEPGLEALANNGGPVRTHAISAGFSAVNSGIQTGWDSDENLCFSDGTGAWLRADDEDDTATNSCNDVTDVTTDARGYTFSGQPDIGAYELGGSPPQE